MAAAVTKPRVPSSEMELWVDKYSPKQYTDLITEEYINREALTWLKSWDADIFPQSLLQNAEMRRFGTMKKELTELRKQILILNGPPGSGKSVLAHTIASHA
jgi:chromosome transmission fidelity protein 18